MPPLRKEGRKERREGGRRERERKERVSKRERERKLDPRGNCESDLIWEKV